jgi:hypothetical protein
MKKDFEDEKRLLLKFKTYKFVTDLVGLIDGTRGEGLIIEDFEESVEDILYSFRKMDEVADIEEIREIMRSLI